jgi:glycosyltransferase involved in cell wall biosynthesis
MKALPVRIAWCFDDEHIHIPNIVAAARSFSRHGCMVTLIDVSPAPSSDLYVHKIVRWPYRFASSFFIFAGILCKALSVRPQMVIGTRPRAAAAAWLAAVLLRGKFVYYPFELYSEQVVPVSRFWCKVELFLLRFCIDALVTQNQERAQFLKQLGARKEPVVIYNYKPARSIAPGCGKLRRILDIGSEKRIVLYEGYLKEGRRLEALVDAARLFPDDAIMVFLGWKFPWWKEVIEPTIAEDLELAARIKVVEWIPQEDLIESMSDADVGVIIYDEAFLNNRFCAPGKLSDYVIAGLPIVAPASCPAARMIVEHEIGRLFEIAAPQEIAAAVKETLNRPQKEWRERLEAARRHLVWETQEPHLMQMAADVMGGR